MQTEKQKMQNHVLYDANNDPALIAERNAAKDLCFEYNQTRPSDTANRERILKQLLGKTPERFEITPPFWCDYGSNIELGENFYANHNLVILDGAKVIFGNNVFIAPDCGFYTAGHPLDAERRNQGLEYAHPICIGDNVWIGGGVKVMPGVSIGSNTVIAAGSIVTKNIPGNVVAGGIPCRVLKQITKEDSQNLYEFGK